MRCPVCNIDLDTTDLSAFGLVVVARCTHCTGTWFAPEQTRLLGEALTSELSAASCCADPVWDHKPCPQCHAHAMVTIRPTDARDLLARRCDGCGGFWLERAPVEPLAAALDEDEHSRIIDRTRVDARPQHWSALRWIAWRLQRCFE